MQRLQDIHARQIWADYSRYLQRTSILIPLPPALYARMPIWIKRTVLFDFPLYVFDPAKHADKQFRRAEDDPRNSRYHDQ